MAFANILKNGCLQQGEQLDILQGASIRIYQGKSVVYQLVLGIAERIFSSFWDMLESTGRVLGEFFEVLIELAYTPDIESYIYRRSTKAGAKSLNWLAITKSVSNISNT